VALIRGKEVFQLQNSMDYLQQIKVEFLDLLKTEIFNDDERSYTISGRTLLKSHSLEWLLFIQYLNVCRA
jgi:hypothetical protein